MRVGSVGHGTVRLSVPNYEVKFGQCVASKNTIPTSTCWWRYRVGAGDMSVGSVGHGAIPIKCAKLCS